MDSGMGGLKHLVNRHEHVSMKNLLDFTPLKQPEKSHLSRVYGSMGVALLLTAMGVHFFNNMMTLRIEISLLLQLVGVMGVTLTSRANMRQVMTPMRATAFGAMAFFMGTMMAPLLSYATAMNAAAVPMAFFGSLAIFCCLSLSAMFAKERSYLFLGPILSSSMISLLILGLINGFAQSTFIDGIRFYGGLLAFMGFVMYHTQVTIEEFKRGHNDYLLHGLSLYTDLVAIFTRLVKALADRGKKDRRE